MINARADKIETATWKPMLKNGRVIVPVDCWYEWIKAEDGKKQPYLLRPKDQKPLFLAGLTNVKVEADSGMRSPEASALVDGVVIVTDASDQGMVDIHDRRPVALNEQDANTWLDSQTPLELAAGIARHGSRAVNEFEWYEVSRELNNVRHDRPELVKPKV